MSARIHPFRARIPRNAAASFLATLIGLATQSRAEVDQEINRQVWKQKFGVLDAQINQQPPYAGWLDQDADGDGVKNRDEFVAGTNPFKKLPTEARFQAPGVIADSNTLTLTFPTVPGKLYGAESSETLVDAWSKGSLPTVNGDGTTKSLVVPKSAGKFFKLSVTDQATQGDLVSDWAKHALGFSMGAPLTSQSSFTPATLAADLQEQNEIMLTAPDISAKQPTDDVAPAGDFGLIRVTRSGFMLLGDVTVPLALSGTAVEGVDFATLPDSVTFPVGVKSLDVKVTPLFNSARTTSATVFLTANAPGSAGASGNYALGSPAAAGVTIYPSGKPTGTGLTATYFPGASSTYTNPLNFGELVPATYSYTRTNSTTGTATITYAGTPLTSFVAGGQVTLQFTSGNLLASFGALNTYTIVSLVSANQFSIGITGTALPNSSSGSTNISGFSSSITRTDPTVDFYWGQGTPNGNIYVNPDNYSVRWDGWLSPAVAGNYVFRLDADDKARVLIDTGSGLQQILENGWDTPATGGYKQSDPIALSIPQAAGNRYPIRVEFVETTGAAKCRVQWRINNGNFVNIPSANIWKDNIVTAATGTNNVWNAAYFSNTTFTPPAIRNQSDSAVTNGNNGDWGTGTPDPLIHNNNFSARWTGQVLPQYSQTYYFVARVDDGVKLWVNNQVIVDRWPGGGATDSTGTIDLLADVLYDIRMEYYEGTSTAEARLSWYSQDQAKQIIPTHRLFPSISGSDSLTEIPVGGPAITSPTHPIHVLGSGSPFTLPLTGSNGGTFTASGLPPWLSLIDGVLTGTPPAAGIYQFTVTTTNSTGSGSVVITLEVQETEGTLTRDLWTAGVTGSALTDVPWTTPPSASDTVPLAEDVTATHGPNTGARLRGYFTAPVSGNYYFWIAASNTAELWISNDSEPVNKVRRASVTNSLPRTWTSQPSQKSHWLTLTAGKKYYIEALHNTGTNPEGNHLSIAWFLDPTGNTVDPIANGDGVIPGHVLSPWDNPPTTTVPGTLHVTNLQGAPGLSNITGTGGSFLRVNGSSAVLQLNYSGLTSGAISKKLYNSSDEVIFDLDAQDKNYPALKTTDGGYTWNLQPADLTELNEGRVRISIATINHPDGELTGTFGKTAGSQTAPAVPPYPTWPDLHATDDAANSRFLSQATFGPSPADMAAVKAMGYRAWIDHQMDAHAVPPTHNLDFVLANIGTDPGNQFGSNPLFNSWWKNAVTAPDQLRQRAAFALSQILVVSEAGPLDNNGRVIASYYDMMLDLSFGNFRDILKEVTLSPAMGMYLDMRGNSAGNIITGLHPNENYAREILQLFSAGLYRIWPNGTLTLNSKGSAIPTYDQSVIYGMSRVFTGWNWSQPINGDRLPASYSSTANYFDPMVHVPSRHELGTKVLLDNVMLPAATVTSSGTPLTETDPVYTVYARATPGGPLVGTDITNQYDRNGLRDLEVTLDNILNNSATGPYICRQLIQRLVTSHPKPDYIHRVVRAFNGEQNVDGVRTGVRGDMKDVFRAILLDYEARSTSAAADPQFGKQREPVMRVTGPARAFPSAPITGATYRGLGYQHLMVTTQQPHRLGQNENVFLDGIIPGSGKSPATGSHTVRNTTPSCSLNGPTGIATINAPGFQTGDTVALIFTSGTIGSTSPFNTVRNYTVLSATPDNFTINIGVTSFSGVSNVNTSLPYNFCVDGSSLSSVNYNVSGTTVTVTASNYVAGRQLYLKFATGGLLGAGVDGIYTIATATGNSFTVNLSSVPASLVSGKVLIPRITGGYRVSTVDNASTITFFTSGNHNLEIGDSVMIDILIPNSPSPATDGVYTVTAVGGPTVFSVAAPSVISSGTQGGSGMVGFPLIPPPPPRHGTFDIDLSTWNISTTQNDLNQTPLNAATVFNFFYPDYQYPGEMAAAGMTTPEFQLSNDSNTMNLTNAVTNVVTASGNLNGYSSYKSNGITLDLGSYMTPSQTSNSGIPGLVDEMDVLLTGGNLTSSTRTTIINFATSLPYITPTNEQMRNRARAVVHFITTSAEYAIQK